VNSKLWLVPFGMVSRSAIAHAADRRHLNGYPDRPPVRPNISLGDSLAGLHAAFGAVMALHAQRRLSGAGQVWAAHSASALVCDTDGLTRQSARFIISHAYDIIKCKPGSTKLNLHLPPSKLDLQVSTDPTANPNQSTNPSRC